VFDIARISAIVTKISKFQSRKMKFFTLLCLLAMSLFVSLIPAPGNEASKQSGGKYSPIAGGDNNKHLLPSQVTDAEVSNKNPNVFNSKSNTKTTGDGKKNPPSEAGNIGVLPLDFQDEPHSIPT